MRALADDTARDKCRRAFAMTLAPEERAEFEAGWEAAWSDLCDETRSPETINRNVENFSQGVEYDVDCLINAVGSELVKDGVIIVASGTVGAIIGIPKEALEAAAFISQSYYNLAVADEYQGAPFDMDKFREKYGEKEDKGWCTGTSLMVVFLYLGIFIVSMQNKRRFL